MKNTILDKLEEIKQAANYAVTMYYGEDIGCDDLEIPPIERAVQVVATPVGHLGEVRTLFKGTIATFENFDPNEKPIRLNNPPKREDMKENGFYAWGSDRSIQNFFEKFKK